MNDSIFIGSALGFAVGAFFILILLTQIIKVQDVWKLDAVKKGHGYWKVNNDNGTTKFQWNKSCSK